MLFGDILRIVIASDLAASWQICCKNFSRPAAKPAGRQIEVHWERFLQSNPQILLDCCAL